MDPVVHFEMPAKDKKRTANFYTKVFGWQMKELGEDMGNYLLATTSPMDEENEHINKGAINGGFFQRGKEGKIPHIVISVKNLEDSVIKVKETGGKILVGPMDIKGIGKFVLFMDTEKNKVGMLQPTNM